MAQVTIRRPLVIIGVIALVAALGGSAAAHPEGPAHHNPLPAHASDLMRAFADDHQAPADLAAMSSTACVDGFAGPYPCRNVDLMAFMPLADIGGTSSNSAANDIWGWTDPATGREYAIIGRVFGTSFVDISDPVNPVYLGDLPTHGAFGSSWRDIKVHADHAFIVSEARSHGMQVFDLRQLSDVTSPPVTFSETAHYNTMSSAHNIAINEDSGFAYIVGASGKNSCSGGLHMVNIQVPASPSFAGCFSADGYTHDTQCVIYSGPDSAHQGKEICVNSNEDTVTIVDVSVKSSPVMLSRTAYPGSAYTHQGWLTEDQRYFVLDDELDEQNFNHNTRTRVWDLADLDAPTLVGFFDSTAAAIDHNQYVKDGFSYQANYRAGLRILDLTGIATADLSEAAYFDIYPADDAAEFNAAWSNYPYFASGLVIVSGIEQGLFILRPDLGGGGGDTPPTVALISPSDGASVSGSVDVTANASDDQGVTQVEFFVDGGSIGIDSDEGDGWSVTWDTIQVADGAHTVSAVASDTAGQTGSDSVGVTVDH
ncbi:MAG TPA: choice-of-anchor B family protein, partial [Euzebya sp.]|nr:choice-of-anchor B family protein [Euzebya sp.]